MATGDSLNHLPASHLLGSEPLLLIIPLEFLRWVIILASGAASASFVALNLRSYIHTNDLTQVSVAAFFLQIGLAIFIKVWFFA